MCRFVVLFAVMCGMACGLWAAESEALDEQKLDEQKVCVLINNTSGTIDESSYRVHWSVAHLKTASGEPFSQAFAVLGHKDGYRKPFTSSVLDDAIQALVKYLESDDQKKEPNETHTPLKQSVKFLSSQSRWIWYVDGLEYCWQYPFVPGSVRIFLRGPQNPFFEGFPAQSDDETPKPFWLRKAEPLLSGMAVGVAAGQREVREEEQKILVQIMRAGEAAMRVVTWDVRGLTVNGRSLWDALLAHPYNDVKKPKKEAVTESHGYEAKGIEVLKNGVANAVEDNILAVLPKKDEDFTANAAIDEALGMFTKALASGEGLTHYASCVRIGNSDADDFKADRWLWWSGPTWKFIPYFQRVPPCPGRVWLALLNEGVTIEGYKI